MASSQVCWKIFWKVWTPLLEDTLPFLVPWRALEFYIFMTTVESHELMWIFFEHCRTQGDHWHVFLHYHKTHILLDILQRKIMWNVLSRTSLRWVVRFLPCSWIWLGPRYLVHCLQVGSFQTLQWLSAILGRLIQCIAKAALLRLPSQQEKMRVQFRKLW
jgi:hypothetical protein